MAEVASESIPSRNRPPAQPPPLFLYVGHRAVDLRMPRIPAQMKMGRIPLSRLEEKVPSRVRSH
jgi:hypothetical protein